MNKKGELITLTIIVGMMVLATFFIVDKHFDAVYIGDSSRNITYNIKSKNQECNTNNIIIKTNDAIHFKNVSEIPEWYINDTNCY